MCHTYETVNIHLGLRNGVCGPAVLAVDGVIAGLAEAAHAARSTCVRREHGKMGVRLFARRVVDACAHSQTSLVVCGAFLAPPLSPHRARAQSTSIKRRPTPLNSRGRFARRSLLAGTLLVVVYACMHTYICTYNSADIHTCIYSTGHGKLAIGARRL